MAVGRIKWFDIDRGFGYITLPEGEDIYVRYADVEGYGRELRSGDQVQFQIVSDTGGKRAVQVTVEVQTRLGYRRTSAPKSKQASLSSSVSSKTEQSQTRNRQYKKPLQRPPSDNYYLAQALLARESRAHDKARELFERAVEVTNKPGAFLAYAAMEKGLHQYDRAVAVLKRGISKFPNRGKLYEDYGNLEVRRGHLERASEIFREGLNHDFAHRILYRNLAIVLLQLGGLSNLEEAKACFEKARKVGVLEPNDQHYELLKLLVGHSRGPLAKEFLEKAGLSVNYLSSHSANTYAFDLFVQAKRPEYLESYDLSDEIPARCLFKANASYEDVESFIRDVQSMEVSRKINRDVLLLILQSSTSSLKDRLYGLLEKAGRNPIVVPIEEAEMRAGIETSDSEGVLKQILDQWLYRRNLYEERFPVSGRTFFGREQELTGLVRSIDSGSPVGLFGLRKVGKTSLLHKLKEKRPQDLVIYIDVQAVPEGVRETGYLYWDMAEQLRAELRRKYIDIARDIQFVLAGRHKNYVSIPDRQLLASAFDADLRSVRELMSSAGKTGRTLVLLDEVERMLPAANSDGFKGYADFFAYLRGISQQEGFLISIVTGANPDICEQPQWEGQDNPVFKFYQETFLPPLERRECNEMIQKLGRGMGITFQTKSLERIYSETGGHPFVTRQLCSRIVRHFTERPLLVDEAKVYAGIEEFLFHDSGTFKEILGRLERDFPQEKELLIFIAEGIDSEHELASLAKTGIHDALRHLVGYQLVQREQTSYKIKVHLLHTWIQRYWLNKEP